MLDITGAAKPPDDLPGRVLQQADAQPRSAVYAENGRPLNGVRLLRKWFPDFDSETIDHPMRMMRTGDLKLIWKADVSAELFDLATDPAEQVDVGRDRPGLRNSLLADLRAWSLEVEPQIPPQAFQSRDRESLERLRALGYVE